MKHRTIPARIAFIACTLTAALAAMPVLGIPRALEAVARPPASSRPVQLDGDHFSAQQIVVKFREGTGIRAAGNGWVTTPAAGTGSDGPALAMVDREVAEANDVVGDIDGVQVLPMVSTTVEAQFGSPTTRGPAPSTRQPADLGLFSYVVLPSPDAAAAQQLIDRLSVIPSVEQAYPQ